jgi:hypothetical protein
MTSAAAHAPPPPLATQAPAPALRPLPPPPIRATVPSPRRPLALARRASVLIPRVRPRRCR